MWAAHSWLWQKNPLEKVESLNISHRQSIDDYSRIFATLRSDTIEDARNTFKAYGKHKARMEEAPQQGRDHYLLRYPAVCS